MASSRETKHAVKRELQEVGGGDQEYIIYEHFVKANIKLWSVVDLLQQSINLLKQNNWGFRYKYQNNTLIFYDIINS